MSFAYSRLGVTVMTLLSLGAAAAFLVCGGSAYRDETAFYATTIPGQARVVSSELTTRAGRKGSIDWALSYEFAAGSRSDNLYRGPTRPYRNAIDPAWKPGDSVSIRYRPDDPSQNALETGGPVLWSSYVTIASGLFSLLMAVSFAASWSGLRR